MHHVDGTYEGLDYSSVELEAGDYDHCIFVECTFSKVNLSGRNFANCRFERCDFSMASLKDVALQDIDFKDCKLVGLRFEDCNDFLFSMRCEGSMLDYSSFYNLDLTQSRFRDSVCTEVDFTGANLSDVILEDCDLARSIFEGCNLERTDFTRARNITMDPEKNMMRGAIFSSHNALSLLSKYQIEIE